MDTWGPAKVWTGSRHQKCKACGEFIARGEWTKVHTPTGNVYHDACAEDQGAYGPDFAIGGVYGVKN